MGRYLNIAAKVSHGQATSLPGRVGRFEYPDGRIAILEGPERAWSGISVVLRRAELNVRQAGGLAGARSSFRLYSGLPSSDNET
ncbi:MAG TPA: hypothetical protein DIC34_01055 [Treponema sp.]|nr:MAG: hypothetical protein A2Y36_00500 [Treponema sp. GWA1_62_8]OHE64512.1 MAG: hypothetical protein A2001_03110 [Treponema sp. GWC1_61_84]OHE71655.1 MAG: hypothetical protein A2413_02095 [Treponema sp. RIFOXYC1_FULL_61_9]HCM25132.1 hypothetical protein [Treponema sp.]